jgi:hypothetical protein
MSINELKYQPSLNIAVGRIICDSIVIAGSTGSFAGPTGATGSPGSASNTGATGYTGYTGYTGPIGYTGSPGSASNTGSTGPTGFTGYTGSAGLPGSASNTGATGFTGPIGYTGFTGYTGSPGLPGSASNTGATGFTGPAGATPSFIQMAINIPIQFSVGGATAYMTGILSKLGNVVTLNFNSVLATGNNYGIMNTNVGALPAQYCPIVQTIIPIIPVYNNLPYNGPTYNSGALVLSPIGSIYAYINNSLSSSASWPIAGPGFYNGFYGNSVCYSANF